MKLFIDDTRACPDGWELARTVTDAIRKLATVDFDEVSLDHDIEGSKETFMPVAHYLAVTMEHHNPARGVGDNPKVLIHTGNYEMGKKMAEILDIPWRPSFYPQDYRTDPDVEEPWEEGTN